jgi:hypothetical protein
MDLTRRIVHIDQNLKQIPLGHNMLAEILELSSGIDSIRKMFEARVWSYPGLPLNSSHGNVQTLNSVIVEAKFYPTNQNSTTTQNTALAHASFVVSANKP